MAKSTKKKRAETPKQTTKLKSPFWDSLAGLFGIRQRWFRKNLGAAKLPTWMRQVAHRDRASKPRSYSFAHLAGPDVRGYASQGRHVESWRSVLARERREGGREVRDQLKRFVDLPEAKGNEVAAFDLALEGIPESVARQILRAMNPRGQWAAPHAQPRQRRSDAHLEVFARSAQSAAAKGLKPEAPAPGESEGKTNGEGSADPEGDKPPP